MLNRTEKGVYTIAPTPFTPDFRVDYDSLGQIIDFYHQSGIDGITILGVMGEAPKLTDEESTAIIKYFRAHTKLKIIVGVTSPGFAQMAKLAKTAMDMGCNGVMVAPQTHLRSDDAICQYFQDATNAIGAGVPICLQDYPLNFTVQITPKTLIRILREIEQITMVKHEDWPGLEKISQLKQAMHDNIIAHTPILCGNGGLFLDFELQRGADGAMTGYCYPELLVKMVKCQQLGQWGDMFQIFNRHLPLVRYEQQPNIGLAVRKYAMMRRGMIRHDTCRHPSPKLSPTARQEIDFLLENINNAE